MIITKTLLLCMHKYVFFVTISTVSNGPSSVTFGTWTRASLHLEDKYLTNSFYFPNHNVLCGGRLLITSCWWWGKPWRVPVRHDIHQLTWLNPLAAKLFNCDFHSIEVVSRWRDPQLQVSENYSDLTKWRSTNFKSCWIMSLFIKSLKDDNYVMC